MASWRRCRCAMWKARKPWQTVVEGTYRDGKLQSLKVTPEARRADVVDLSKS